MRLFKGKLVGLQLPRPEELKAVGNGQGAASGSGDHTGAGQGAGHWRSPGLGSHNGVGYGYSTSYYSVSETVDLAAILGFQPLGLSCDT